MEKKKKLVNGSKKKKKEKKKERKQIEYIMKGKLLVMNINKKNL